MAFSPPLISLAPPTHKRKRSRSCESLEELATQKRKRSHLHEFLQELLTPKTLTHKTPTPEILTQEGLTPETPTHKTPAQETPTQEALTHKTPSQEKIRSLSHESCLNEEDPSQQPQVDLKESEQLAELPTHPVAYWAATGHWPETFKRGVVRMSQVTPSKRKSSTPHHSDRLEQLGENGIYMRESKLMLKTSEDACSTLLLGDRVPAQFPCYPLERLSDIMDRIQPLNEARLQRDIMPWIVPSAENMYFSGEITIAYLGDEVQADWIRCTTMGSTRPKPDYTTGLLRSAFNQGEIDKLQNYCSFERPWLFTPNLCFPFLICEAKTGQVGMDKADRQNIHSASIAVAAIIELYKAAFGTTKPEKVQELYGKVLVFSVSHNNKQVNLFGHYAVLDEYENPAVLPLRNRHDQLDPA